MPTTTSDDRLDSASNPLNNDNVLKLAVFATNGSGGSFTIHEDRFEPTWEANRRVAQLADEIGFEAIIPFARWLPYSGIDGSPSGRTLDPIAWAAGLAAITKRICVMSTIHTFLHHPLVIAKMGATIDQISNGRWGLNIVCGWFKPEFDMFGQAIQSHENRFDAADEWVEIIERAWSEKESFDYDGSHYHLKGAYSDPKPV